MNSEKREGFEKQLRRQNKLLDMVMEQNDHLRASLTYLGNLLGGIIISPDTIAEINGDKTVSGSTIAEKLYSVGISAGTIADLMEGKNVFRSTIAEKMDSINVSGDTIANLMKGEKVLEHTTAGKMDGINVLGHTITDLMDGINILEHTTADLMDGKNVFEDGYAEKMDGINKMVYPAVKTELKDVKSSKANVNKANITQTFTEQNRKNENPADGLPAPSFQNKNEPAASAASLSTEQKVVKPVRLSNLITYLSFIVVRSNYTGLENSAKILIRLLDSPKQSLKDLQKITGLSSDGIGKRIVAMKRFGLIVRGPNRQLLLTEKARQAIENSRV